MTVALTDQTLGNLACSIPGATRVFHQYRLDFCCGGNVPLHEAATSRGLDAAQIAAELAALGASADGEPDWRSAPTNELIEHILERFHERHREQLPELIRLASRVEHVHGAKPDCPNGLAEMLWTLQQELESHMLKEEQILFPMLQRGINHQQDWIRACKGGAPGVSEFGVAAKYIEWLALGAIAIATLASVLPARRAARLHPVRALRYE